MLRTVQTTELQIKVENKRKLEPHVVVFAVLVAQDGEFSD